jgi:hypothetical protein
MPRMPAITTGTMDFITNSGRITPMAAMPTPLFAVPYAEPKPERGYDIHGHAVHDETPAREDCI